MKKDYYPPPKLAAENHFREDLDSQMLQTLLGKKGYRITKTDDGFKAAKHRIGTIGSTVTHAGIVIIMLGSFVGNFFGHEGFFNMLPGDIRSFQAQGFSLRLDDFYLGFREDGSIEQYFSELSIIESGAITRSKKIWVNNPLKHNSIDFYQTSYGWASELNILDSDGKVVATRMLRNNETHFYQPNHLSIYLYGFFPDMEINQMGEPYTKTHRKDNPFYAVILYHFNDHVGSYVLEPNQAISFGDISIVFPDSHLYTGLTYGRDFGYPFVLIGSFLLLLGLLFSFYNYPKFIILEGDSLKVVTRQNTWGLNYQLKRYVEKTSQNP